jgi:hypothetical protein
MKLLHWTWEQDTSISFISQSPLLWNTLMNYSLLSTDCIISLTCSFYISLNLPVHSVWERDATNCGRFPSNSVRQAQGCKNTKPPNCVRSLAYGDRHAKCWSSKGGERSVLWSEDFFTLFNHNPESLLHVGDRVRKKDGSNRTKSYAAVYLYCWNTFGNQQRPIFHLIKFVTDMVFLKWKQDLQILNHNYLMLKVSCCQTFFFLLKEAFSDFDLFLVTLCVILRRSKFIFHKALYRSLQGFEKNKQINIPLPWAYL